MVPTFGAPDLAARGCSRTTQLSSLALALLLAAMSLVAIVHPALYRHETPSYAAQALGQDWADLLVGAPWLVVAARTARRGSRRGQLLLGGGLAYALYEFLIYAFAVHFNGLFLVYCAGLGLSVLALVTMLAHLTREDVRSWFVTGAPLRGPAAFLFALGVMFAFAWLSEVVPALVRGTVPASILEAGLLTNPVHVIDLSLLLPAHFAAGVLAFRRHAAAYALAPVLLAFDVLMSLSIAAVALGMFMLGLTTTLSITWVMLMLCLASASLLTRLLADLCSQEQ